jgi:23S rRNA (uracil1939-C5)-methyltransferase
MAGGDKREERVTLRLDSLAFGGDAVGRDAGGRVVFVPAGVPGDLVEVRIAEAKKSWARGEIVRLLEPGRRVTPPCPLALECGGCPWMHVDVPAQLESKQQIVAHALGKSGVEVLPIVRAPETLGYRRRAKMTARGRALGFLARRSHRIVDVPRCPALDLRLDAAMQVARERMIGLLGEGGTLSGLVSHDGRVHLVVECGPGAVSETVADHAAELAGHYGIVGVGVRSADTRRFYGEARLELDEQLESSAAGFAQANAAQNEVLRRLVRAWTFEGMAEMPRVLELYAGDGNFTRDLVKQARVVAVEGEPEASARLVDNLRKIAPRTKHGPHTTPSFDRWNVRAEPSEQAVRKLADAGEQFDVVVLDPPRAGAAECLDAMVRLQPSRIVYVSCDPMTLARDLVRLGDRGYRALRAQPVDMMPHTSHVEVVCVLERVGDAR